MGRKWGRQAEEIANDKKDTGYKNSFSSNTGGNSGGWGGNGGDNSNTGGNSGGWGGNGGTSTAPPHSPSSGGSRWSAKQVEDKFRDFDVDHHGDEDGKLLIFRTVKLRALVKYNIGNGPR
ncbi:unnamed protein product [Strongylus vulgaris]|uniref:Uncharacterized protein n=1 Tax=Strongylus vulgaris TaxID=40348 RepID=A0A3P7IWH2_STRVU|nr:unnamed protein product [Strongylus vulgaris]